MAWLWTDTLAALLVEHDHVPDESVADWVRHPTAHRLSDGDDPLVLARRLLEDRPPGAVRPARPA
jgi:hypothetical protein